MHRMSNAVTEVLLLVLNWPLRESETSPSAHEIENADQHFQLNTCLYGHDANNRKSFQDNPELPNQACTTLSRFRDACDRHLLQRIESLTVDTFRREPMGRSFQ